jgi:ABC-type Fe3+/spermidine/putrescine transport system ATPase subunit
VVIRPEVPILLVDDGIQSDNVVEGVVVEAVYLGNAAKYRLSITENTELIVRWPSRPREMPFKRGARLRVGWSARDIHLLPVVQE